MKPNTPHATITLADIQKKFGKPTELKKNIAKAIVFAMAGLNPSPSGIKEIDEKTQDQLNIPHLKPLESITGCAVKPRPLGRGYKALGC